MTTEMLAQAIEAGGPVAEAAAQTLASMGADAAPACPTLLASVADPGVGEWCIAALEGLGRPLPAQAGPLAEFAASPHEETAYWAATLLGRLGPEAASATGVLAEVVRGVGPLSVRERAAWAIGKIGPPAADAGPALNAAAAAGETRLARLANEALESIGGA